MNQLIRSATAAAIFTALCACSHAANPIEGEWSVDLAPMVEQANGLGASAQEIRKIKETFADARLAIDAKSLHLSISGQEGGQDMPYTIKSGDDTCQHLAVQGVKGDVSLCIKNDRLEFHDPATPLIVTYRRS